VASGGGYSLPLNARGFETIPTTQPLSNDGSGSLVIPISADVSNATGYVYSTGTVQRVIAGRVRATLAVTASDAARFAFWPEPGQCGDPSWRVILFAHDLMGMPDWGNEYARWWSRASGKLAAGTVTLEVSLQVANWSNVAGGQDAARFASALSNISHLGITFGADCFYGHGVWMQSGTATARLTEFRVLP
jgi:hypothetical protein